MLSTDVDHHSRERERAAMAQEEAITQPLQVKVTLEFSGEGAEVAAMLEAVSRVLSNSPSHSPAAADASWWTPETATAFIRRLKRPALHALRTIAAGAPKVRI